MPINYVRYELENGFVHNWLVAGPQTIPVLDLDRFQGEDWKFQIARHYYATDSGVIQMPVENEPFEVGEAKLGWSYFRCDDDHFVDRTAFYHTCHYLMAWAYSRIESPAAQEVTCVLTTNGPADVWLNGQHVHRQEHFYHQIPHSVSFQAGLAEGPNEFLVRFEEVAARECPYAMALRVAGLPPEAFVFLPTLHEGVARRQTVEKTIESAYLDRDVFVWDDPITVYWPKDMAASSPLTLRLQRPEGWIYSEARRACRASRPAAGRLRRFRAGSGTARAARCRAGPSVRASGAAPRRGLGRSQSRIGARQCRRGASRLLPHDLAHRLGRPVERVAHRACH